ncbi:MAG: hypothetical protein Q8940_14670 [Bacteroidota bacterium]|nr:hypothetical protein [Bacteroidota bacterium]
MKHVKKNNGFTLIEILVGINLSFIVITAGTALFLFTNKFIIGSLNRMQEKYSISSMINGFEETLKKSETFTVSISSYKTIITFDNNSVMEFSYDKITLKNYELSHEMDSYIISINMKTGEEVTIENGTIKGFYKKGNIISEDEIKSISLNITKAKNSYEMKYNIPQVSINQFRNI